MFGCDGISDHASWNEVFHYKDTKLSCCEKDPIWYQFLKKFIERKKPNFSKREKYANFFMNLC